MPIATRKPRRRWSASTSLQPAWSRRTPSSWSTRCRSRTWTSLQVFVYLRCCWAAEKKSIQCGHSLQFLLNCPCYAYVLLWILIVWLMIGKVLLWWVRTLWPPLRWLGCVKRDVGPKQQVLGDAFSRKVKRTSCLRISLSCRSIVSLQSVLRSRTGLQGRARKP